MKQYRNYVDGEWVSSARRFDDLNPADGSRVAQVHEADRAVVARLRRVPVATLCAAELDLVAVGVRGAA